MTVYVDNLGVMATVADPDTGRAYCSRWSHLFSSEIDQAELHEFARRIGLKRSWFQVGRQLMHPDQHDPVLDHYDVTAGKRQEAVAGGAVEVTLSEAGELWAAKRQAVRALNATRENS